MKKNHLLFVMLLLGTSLTGLAEGDLDFAFSQLKGNGPVPFANALYQDPGNASVLIDRLNRLVQGAGDFNSYEIVSRRYLTKKIERVVVALYFDRFPLFLRIDYYDTAKGKICLPANLSREAADILPLDLISVAGR